MGESLDVRANAHERAPGDNVWDWLSEREADPQPSQTTAEEIDQLIRRIKQKQNEFHKSRTRYVDGIVKWLHKLKDIGDAVPSFDPIHAALRLLTSTPRFLSPGRVWNTASTQQSMQIGDEQDSLDLKRQYLDKFHNELTGFYSKSIGVLHHWYSNLLRNQVRRKVAAVLNLSEQVDILSELEAQRKQVIECGEACERVLHHRIADRSWLTPGAPIHEISQVPLQIDKQAQIRLPKGSSDLGETKRKKAEDTRDWILRRKKAIERKNRDSRIAVLYGDRICVLHFCALLLHATSDSSNPFLISKVVGYSTDDVVDNKAAVFFSYKRDKSNRGKRLNILCSILRQLSSIGSHPPTQSLSMCTSQVLEFDVLTSRDFMGGLMKLIKAIYLSQRLYQHHELHQRHRNTLHPLQASLPKGSSNFGFQTPLLKIFSTSSLFLLLRNWVQKAGVEFNPNDLKDLSRLSIVVECRRESVRLFLTEKKHKTNHNSLSPIESAIQGFCLAAFKHFIKGATNNNSARLEPASLATSTSDYRDEIRSHFPQAGACIDGRNQILLERKLNTNMLLYHSVDPSNPLVYINKAGYEITKACIFYQTGCHSYLPPWFLATWELQTSSNTQASFLSQLQQWQPPGTLPSRLTLVAELTSISGVQQKSSCIISVQDNRSWLVFVPARGKHEQPSKTRIENTRWKPCISGDIAATNITHHTVEVDPLDAEVTTALEKTQVYMNSQYDIPVSWGLIAFSVGFLAWIFGLCI